MFLSNPVGAGWPTAQAAGGGTVTYFAIGDSFSSGEGAGSYDAKTDIPQWQSRQADPKSGDMCHRSPNGYPRILAQRNKDLNLTFTACSGALIRHVRNTEHYDGVKRSCRRGACEPRKETGGDTPGGQVSTFASSGANLVTVTIGGNDADFAGILAYCVEPWHKRCDLDLDAKETQLIESVYTSLYDTYRQIRDAAAYGQVLVLGYPQIFQTEVDCGGTLELQPEERTRLRERFSQMDDVIERRLRPPTRPTTKVWTPLSSISTWKTPSTATSSA